MIRRPTILSPLGTVPSLVMPIRPIIRYPDPRLSLPAQPVTVFDGALRELANDLLETMHAAPGIGITGPHTDRRAILDKAIADHKATQSYFRGFSSSAPPINRSRRAF